MHTDTYGTHRHAHKLNMHTNISHAKTQAKQNHMLVARFKWLVQETAKTRHDKNKRKGRLIMR